MRLLAILLEKNKKERTAVSLQTTYNEHVLPIVKKHIVWWGKFCRSVQYHTLTLPTGVHVTFTSQFGEPLSPEQMVWIGQTMCALRQVDIAPNTKLFVRRLSRGHGRSDIRCITWGVTIR